MYYEDYLITWSSTAKSHPTFYLLSVVVVVVAVVFIIVCGHLFSRFDDDSKVSVSDSGCCSMTNIICHFVEITESSSHRRHPELTYMAN